MEKCCDLLIVFGISSCELPVIVKIHVIFFVVVLDYFEYYCCDTCLVRFYITFLRTNNE